MGRTGAKDERVGAVEAEPVPEVPAGRPVAEVAPPVDEAPKPAEPKAAKSFGADPLQIGVRYVDAGNLIVVTIGEEVIDVHETSTEEFEQANVVVTRT